LLSEVPLAQVIKAHYPDDYRSLGARLRAHANPRPEQLDSAMEETLGALMRRQRPKANAESSYALYAAARAEGGALRQVDPAGCTMFMDGKGAPPSLDRVLTPELKARDFAAASRLLTQTASKPAPPAKPMTMEELLPLGQEAISTLPEGDQDLVIKVLKEARDAASAEESRVMCDFNLALADVILSRPQPAAGALIRSLWAMNDAGS
jgi:hypothetical protein